MLYTKSMKVTLILVVTTIFFICAYILYGYYVMETDRQCFIDATSLSDPFMYGHEFVLENIYKPCGVKNPEAVASSTTQACFRDYYQSEKWEILRQKTDVALDKCKKRIKERWVY